MAVIARYDLSRELLSFDFYGWLVQVRARGATEIVFDTRHLKDRRRFESIIEPGPAFLNLPARQGEDGEVMASSRLRHLVAFAVDWTLPRLRSILAPGSARYTVTLRRQNKSPQRNSNERAWRLFADRIGARVIEDWSIKPIHLHERMALYAGAEMNFGVTCGPMSMCSLSQYPCAIFNYGHEWGNGFWEKTGISRGMNMPWMGPGQHAIWQPDHYASIMSWFERWRDIHEEIQSRNADIDAEAEDGDAARQGTNARQSS